MKGQIEIHQRLQDEVTNRSESLEAEIISLKEDMYNSNKKNVGLEAENISLKVNLEESNKKNKEPLLFEKEGLEPEIISLKEDLEKSNKKNEELQQTCEENENWLKEEILNLNDQVEDGRRKEESMTKQCQALEVEVNILKGKLEEKVKLLRFQDSTNILDNILSSQRSPSIKLGLGFHETVKGESSSQRSAKSLEDVNAKPEVLKETKDQPTMMKSKIKSVNNVECFKCHNYGHVAANCRSRSF